MLDLRKFSSRSFDWPLLISALLMTALGLTAIYSVDLSRGKELILFKKQLLAAGLGLALLITASLTHHSWFRAYAKYFYFTAILLLVGVLIFGTTINGTRGWFVLAKFSFQPVEFTKLAIILVLAYVIYHFGRRFDRPLFFFGTLIITGLVIGLVLLQPDLGSAAIIGIIWFGLMLLVGVRWRYVVGLVGLGLLLAVLSWFFLLKPYQQDRLRTFINPERDALGAGYNITQATIAVGAGRVFGRGLGFGSQSQLRFLPEAQTDFIFSVIGEELGLAGATVLLILMFIAIWRLTVIIKRCNDDFSASVISGIAIMFFSQFVINVGANIGLLPITGVTLPFVSYGGTSLYINLLLIGIAESMVGKRY